MNTCDIDGCEGKYYAKGFCEMHYARKRRTGTTSRMLKDWKGEGYISMGYRFKKKKLEHITVAENVLGKPLPARAEVHHIDGNKLNNAPSNLVICQDNAYHSALHARERAFDRTHGAYRVVNSSKWFATISINNKTKRLGTFDSKEDAYDARQIHYFGCVINGRTL